MEKAEFMVYVLYDTAESRYYWKGNKDDGVVDLESATVFYSKVEAQRVRDRQNSLREWNFEVVDVKCTLEEKENGSITRD